MRPTDEQIERFRTQGFLHAGSVFTHAELEELAGEYDRLVNFDAQVLGNPDDGVYPYRAMLSFRSPVLRRFINHPELVELVMGLLGPDLRLWWDQGINKAPGSGSVIPWHQDNAYSPGRVPEYVTTWLALDDSDAANGGLFAVPGSHRRGHLEHAWQGVHACLSDERAEADRAVAVDVKAGEHLIFSSLLVHQTVGNHTRDRQRRAWVMQYARADARNEVTGDVYDDRAWVAKDGAVVAEPWSERRFDIRGSH